VSECDREASIMRRPWPTGGCWHYSEGRVEGTCSGVMKISVIRGADRGGIEEVCQRLI
jgi:hypothetical protein